MNVTQWHKGSDKPVRVGVYQRKIEGELLWTYWTGNEWACLFSNKKDAGNSRVRGYYQNELWRGIAK